MNSLRFFRVTVAGLLVALATVIHTRAQIIYTQALTGAFAPGSNGIEKSATAPPNDAASFAPAVAAAYATNSGGVFDLPTSVSSGTTVFRGTFGPENSRVLLLTSSVAMQNVTDSGTFTPVSGGNATTPNADRTGYQLRVGPVLDAATDLPIPFVVRQIGFVILARTHATYPCDVQATVFFSDGTSQSVLATVGNPKRSDDTFFGFTAPEACGITNLVLESFVSGTTVPVSTRICWDDFGFVVGPSELPPPPTIYNVYPANFAMHAASNGVRFQVQSTVAVPPANIGLVLNGTDVSPELVITGDPTNRSVEFSGLLPDVEYTMTITATNTGGGSALTQTFYTFTRPVVFYDSEGFTDETLYPLGPLQAVTHGRATWQPNASEPAEIVDAGPPQGKVLQRLNTGRDRFDALDFPPVSSGTLTVEFDARVSSPATATLYVSLQPYFGGTTMASYLSWGDYPAKLAYYDNVAWRPLADLSLDWQHYSIVHYLSGPAAGRYDVLINGVMVGLRIPWRNVSVGTALGRLRLQSFGIWPVLEWGQLDNLVITAGPETADAFVEPTVSVISPTAGSITRTHVPIRFTVVSGVPISATNVTLVLDGAVVSPVVSESPTGLSVQYDQPLAEGNHEAILYATNAIGVGTASVRFITTEESWLVEPSDGWSGPWQWSAGQPELRTDDPLDGNGLYLRLDTTNSAFRNLMRVYTSRTDLDLSQPYYIRWKFRLPEADFAANFIGFDDRVHFFAHDQPRLGGSTEGNNSWAISATGAEQTPGSGVSAGQRFYIYDNVDGTGTYNLTNLVDSGIPLYPYHIYRFEVLVQPETGTYTVRITDETSGTSFTSPAPHRFRSANVTPTSHTYLHFGGRARAAGIVRPIDLDSVQVVPAALPPVHLLSPRYAGRTFSFDFVSQSGATPQSGATHVVEYCETLPTPTWQTLLTLQGDGARQTVVDTNASAARRFYRVRTQ